MPSQQSPPVQSQTYFTTGEKLLLDVRRFVSNTVPELIPVINQAEFATVSYTYTSNMLNQDEISFFFKLHLIIIYFIG
ncbi:hypothetical protein QE152_g898 [Popillia japonica]|uniref:Uncharacterized protein n=1 Tax=Popillia japonica TaxID=7064 RepID=A0AAW1N9Y2_POPJA